MATVTAEVGMVFIELPTLTKGMALVTHLKDNRGQGHKHNFSRSFVCKLLPVFQSKLETIFNMITIYQILNM